MVWFLQVFFVTLLSTSAIKDGRWGYPEFDGINASDRATCYAAADAARNANLSTPDAQEIFAREVEAYSSCAKGKGYK